MVASVLALGRRRRRRGTSISDSVSTDPGGWIVGLYILYRHTLILIHVWPLHRQRRSFVANQKFAAALAADATPHHVCPL